MVFFKDLPVNRRSRKCFPRISRSVDEIFFGLGINFYAEGFFSYALFFRASPPPPSRHAGAMVSGVVRMVFPFVLLDSLFVHTPDFSPT